MLTELDIKCLFSIADDYEEIPQIKLDFLNNAATDVPADAILSSLHELVRSGFAEVYRYDEAKQDYVSMKFDSESTFLPIATKTWLPGQSSASRFWFYITPAGKKLLEGQANPWVDI